MHLITRVFLKNMVAMILAFTALLAAASGSVIPTENGLYRQQNILAEGPKCPLEDPLIRIEPTPVNATLHPLAQLLEGSVIENLNLVGLSTFRYNFTINVILLTASFEVTLGRLEGNATYQGEGYVDARPLPSETAPSGNFTGHGASKVLIENLIFKGRAAVIVNIIGNKVQLTNLVLSEVSFGRMALDFENYVIDGELVDWSKFNENVKENFDRDWPLHGTALSEKFKQAANNYLGKYTLAELIDLIENGSGNGDCDESTSTPQSMI